MKVLVALVLAPLSVHAASFAANVESIFVDHNEDTATPAPQAKAKGVSENSYKKINMVIETLSDILQSVKDEESQQSQNHQEFSNWCGKEEQGLGEDLNHTRDDLQEASAHSEEVASAIATLKANIAKDTKELEETKDAVAQSTNLRHSENEEYTEDMMLNTQSLRQITDAAHHIGSIQHEGGFLQNGAYRNLRITQPGDSSYVLGIMKGLKDKLDKSRDVMQKTELDKVHMYDDFMHTKGELQHNLESSLSDDKISLAEAEAHLTGVLRHIAKLKDEAADLAQHLDKTKEKCDTAQKQWEVRQEDRAKEKAALSEAIRYLNQTAKEKKVFLEMSSESSNHEDDQAMVFATSFLQVTRSHKSHSLSDEFADADEDKEDMPNFDAVKGVVREMIAYHQDTQKDETSKRKYCENEISDLDDQKAETTDDLNAITANIEKKESDVDTLGDEIDHLYNEIDQIKERLGAALEIRKKEHATFEQGTKDRSMAMRILGQAKSVLQSFYAEGNSDGTKTEKADEKTSRKTVASFGAVSMIQGIIDDVSKEQREAAADEKDSHNDFEELGVESEKTTDEKQQIITDRTKTRAKLRVQLNSLRESKTTKTNEIQALTQQLGAAHSECDELLKNYDQRLKGRSFEVEQLRDVMDVLSGSSIAARTGFLDESAVSNSGHLIASSDSDSDEFDIREDKNTEAQNDDVDDEKDKKEEEGLRAKEDALMKSLVVK
jgi:hypothetical protein